MKHDLVLIEGLEVRTVIGIYDWEREIRQTVRLDLEMAWDISNAGKTDDIVYALDYKAVTDELITLIEQSKFKLVEALAESCAALVREKFGVVWVRLKVSKPLKYLGMEYASIVIERGCLHE